MHLFQSFDYVLTRMKPGLDFATISSEWVAWMPISEEMSKLNLIPAIKTFEFVYPIANKYNSKESLLFIIVNAIRDRCTTIGNRLIKYFDKNLKS